jgi:hypothetical protein
MWRQSSMTLRAGAAKRLRAKSLQLFVADALRKRGHAWDKIPAGIAEFGDGTSHQGPVAPESGMLLAKTLQMLWGFWRQSSTALRAGAAESFEPGVANALRKSGREEYDS